ncbi:THI20 [[Candida] subhashii]|uniref:THI20 n=1 Tax=[Candida] subhashii TaxID=561895 RepID=A0A8J5QQL6_9ASCO|nr:THI20 [[Candida] subhashii]KAG7664658.1 THI20 [[Candida] subhashii]
MTSKTRIYKIKRVNESIPKVELPAVLTIAGSDSSGGAGIEADLKTFSAFQVYGMTCIAALTAQNTTGVKSFIKTPQPFVKQILDSVLDDMLYGYPEGEAPLRVIKTGMLTSEAILEIKEHLPRLKQYGIKIVIDPVMISTSGAKLFDDEGMKLCVKDLMQQAFLITPNFPESETLYNLTSANGEKRRSIESLDDFVEYVIELQQQLQCENLLVKGGHIPFDSNLKPILDVEIANGESHVFDVLYESSTGNLSIFDSDYINTPDSHGTGCTLASAIAANLAKGRNLNEAIPISVDYIHRGMLSMGKKLGFGNGPLNHNVPPSRSTSHILESSGEEVREILAKSDSFLEYLINHPKVKDNWKKYTQHPFVKILAENKLPFDKFLYFLKQDYHYLINYAQLHALAASVAPTYQQTHAQATIIGEIVTELERHKAKLCKKFNIDYDRDMDLDIGLNPGKACLEYCNYLLDVGKRENFLGIKVALAPCLHGYHEAGKYGQEIRKQQPVGELGVLDQEQVDTYQSWLDDYTSDWYSNAHNEGKKALQSLADSTNLNTMRLEELVDIFNKVTLLEVNFWNEVLQLE